VNHTPAERAALDQADAELDARLELFLASIREQIAKSGEDQALANAAGAILLLPERSARQYLLTAIQRLLRETP
jgi:hypothetical protein